MHLSLPPLTSLLLLPLLLSLPTLSIAAPAPDPDPAPAVVPIPQAKANVPIKPPGFSSSASLQVASGDTRIYYQSIDGAIHEIGGFGSPTSGNVYNDITLLPVGKAQIGTPLVAVDLNLDFSIRLYYITPKYKLQEYVYSNGWKDGALNSANIFTRPGSSLLWAVSVPGSFKPRVGYVSAEGELSEVAYDGKKWNKYVF